MYPFHKVLARLRAAVAEPQRGVQADMVLIQKRDLHELLRDWERLDDAARAHHRNSYLEAYPGGQATLIRATMRDTMTGDKTDAQHP